MVIGGQSDRKGEGGELQLLRNSASFISALQLHQMHVHFLMGVLKRCKVLLEAYEGCCEFNEKVLEKRACTLHAIPGCIFSFW